MLLHGKDIDFDLVLDSKLANNEYSVAKLAAARAAEHTSLAAKFCTPDIWEQYKDSVSSGPAKWTIARAINSGVMFPHSFVGCHAGDAESYDDFKDIFYHAIQAYHKGFDIETTKHATDMDPSKITIELSETAQSKIISTRIRVARNLSMFPLNPGGTLESRLEVTAMMGKVDGAIEGDLAGDFFRHTTMSTSQHCIGSHSHERSQTTLMGFIVWRTEMHSLHTDASGAGVRSSRRNTLSQRGLVFRPNGTGSLCAHRLVGVA